MTIDIYNILYMSIIIDEIAHDLKSVKFMKSRGVNDSRRKKTIDNKVPDILLFGLTRYITLKTVKPSRATILYPTLYSKLQNWALITYPNLIYTHIQINKNVTTSKHRDTYNIGDTLIFTCGDFTGGGLMFEGCESDSCIDVYHKPYIFNGSKVLHWTEPFIGERYCIIFYNNPKIMATIINPVITNFKTVHKWTYKSLETNVNKLILEYRPKTTDEKVIDEVLHRHVYQNKKIDFLMHSTQNWLDLGANIGTFALSVLSFGASVVCFEPEDTNFNLLVRNVLRNFPNGKHQFHRLGVACENSMTELYLCKGEYNKYRHTILPVKGRSTVMIETKSLETILTENPNINCIKIDIEGAEIKLLKTIDLDILKNIKFMIFEYSFDFNPSIQNFMEIINRLKTVFNIVEFNRVNENELVYNFYPSGVNVFCIK
jgi:FkbM family methyltransferase